MKKIISLILCVLLTGVIFTGCSLFEHNYEKDYAQVIVTINAMENQKVNGQKHTLDEKGLPVYDVEGNPVMENVSTTFSSPKIEIYKSQLVNYVEYYLSSQLQNGADLQTSLDYFVEMLISTELLIIEADKLFDAGILYWTKEDVDNIQHLVYTSISNSLFTFKNEILAANDMDVLPEKGADPSTGETTYPVMPEENAEEIVSPAYPVVRADNHQWFENWYTEDTWYIEGNAYKNTYPGLYGTSKDKSLASEAFANYIDSMIEKSENIIGITKAETAAIKEEVKEIERIKSKQGIEYVYPMLGKTLLFKLLVGNSYIKSLKMEKLEAYITKNVEISAEDVNDYYTKLLAEQKRKYVTRATYDSAVSAGDTILYTPSSRYVYVKHILLPFTTEQTALLATYKKQEGITEVNKDKSKHTDAEKRYLEKRAALARKIPVYPHVNGEDDVANVTTVAKATEEITTVMRQYENSAYHAERAFTEFIYKYNTDPGIFGNEKGYSVVYELEAGESETYMIEFAEAARAFRKQGYKIGQVFYDTEILDEKGKAVPYIITDYGIHIMYYCLDTSAGDVKGLSDYVTAGKYNKIGDLMETATLEAAQANAYDFWQDRYIKDTIAAETKTNQKIIDKYYDELNKLIYGK